ncbi:MAG: ABC transporter ATP-binding protein [Lautropia sp.]
MTALSLSKVHKAFGRTEVIRGVDLVVDEGEFVVLVGPSGCGKSTLLRMICGLEDITGGDLHIRGRRMNDVQPAKRGVAMVFQSYALYPHLTVRENLAFGLKVRKEKAPEIARRVAGAAATLQLEPLLERFPRELSGGQRQRVAIGRAIVGEPDVFLFDEPLSNLDAELRVHMRGEIAALHRRLSNTMIYVTHDQIEAMTLADRIVVLRDGRIEQVGSPRELYARPANVFVAQFIGSPRMNVLPLHALGPGFAPLAGGAPAGAASVGLRPEHLRLVAPAEATLSGEVRFSEYTGAGCLLHVGIASGDACLASVDADAAPRVGDRVDLGIDAAHLHFFDEDGRTVHRR